MGRIIKTIVLKIIKKIIVFVFNDNEDERLWLTQDYNLEAKFDRQILFGPLLFNTYYKEVTKKKI